MQSIAAEFNLAETTFVLPPKDPAHTAEVRIFTPKAEMPFAGHPNVGTAFVLARAGQSYGRAVTGDRLVFEEKAGLVRMELTREAGVVIATRLAAPVPLSIGEEIAPEIVAEACSLKPSDIEVEGHRPCIASCGIPLVFAELTSRAALAGAAVRTDVLARHLPIERAVGIHLYVAAKEHGVEIQSRMFAPLLGVPEDPATGGANVALIGLLAHHRPEADLVAGQDHRPGLRHGTAQHPRRRGREEGRHGDRDLYRRALRADDEGHDRPHLRPHLTRACTRNPELVIQAWPMSAFGCVSASGKTSHQDRK